MLSKWNRHQSRHNFMYEAFDEIVEVVYLLGSLNYFPLPSLFLSFPNWKENKEEETAGKHFPSHSSPSLPLPFPSPLLTGKRMKERRGKENISPSTPSTPSPPLPLNWKENEGEEKKERINVGKLWWRSI